MRIDLLARIEMRLNSGYETMKILAFQQFSANAKIGNILCPAMHETPSPLVKSAR